MRRFILFTLVVLLGVAAAAGVALRRPDAAGRDRAPRRRAPHRRLPRRALRRRRAPRAALRHGVAAAAPDARRGPASRSSPAGASGSSTPGRAPGTTSRSGACAASASAPCCSRTSTPTTSASSASSNLQTWVAGRAGPAARVRPAGRRARRRGLPGGLRARHAAIASRTTAPSSCPRRRAAWRRALVARPGERDGPRDGARGADGLKITAFAVDHAPGDAGLRLPLRLPRPLRRGERRHREDRGARRRRPRRRRARPRGAGEPPRRRCARRPSAHGRPRVAKIIHDIPSYHTTPGRGGGGSRTRPACACSSSTT